MLNGALPTFEIEGGWPLALVRGLTDAGLLSVFGTLLYGALVLPAALRSDAGTSRRLLALSRAGIGVAIVASLGWLALEAHAIADSEGPWQILAAGPGILTGTLFGHLIGAQIAALLVTVLALGNGREPARWWLATGLSTIATGLQAGHGHAMAMYDGPSLLLLSGVVHLLAAGAWLGGLLPLTLVVGTVPPQIGAQAAHRFSTLGQLSVAGLALSAAYQFWVMIGGIPGLVGTAYGWVIAIKTLLLAALLGFAATNRYRLLPSLARTGERSDARMLRNSIGLETGIGLLVVLAAGVLSSLPPAMHIQPVWPFSDQPSLVTVEEDPSFRLEATEAVAALALACALLLAGALSRRLKRWAFLAGSVTLVCFAVPHLGLFLVSAYPTSFYRSPTGFASNAIVEGADLYPEQCARCHGAAGRGDGPDAKGLRVPPADLTAEHLWAHSDGELFWWLSHGIEAPEGGLAMPGFSDILSEDQRWDLIDYIRAHNAGLVLSRTGGWAPPVQAPDMPVACPDRAVSQLRDLRGRVLRLVFALGSDREPGAGPPRSSADVTSIWVRPDVSASSGICTATDPDAWRAYAIVTATAPAALSGTQFIVDGSGFLRMTERPSEASTDWNDPTVLEGISRTVSANPILDTSASPHHHH